MAEVTLEILMEAAHQGGLAIARTEELLTPMLTYALPDGTVGYESIAIPGVRPADAAKIILAATRATMAAICFESWQVNVPATDEQRAAWEQKREVPQLGVRPSQHPDRFECLMLLGEIKGQQQVQKCWRIQPPASPGGERQFIYEERWGKHEQLPSNFTPLFVPYEEIRELARHHAVLAGLRDQVRGRRS